MIQEPKESNKPPVKPQSVEALIRYNGELIESLLSSEVWKEIAFPLLQELIAGVSGRFANNRFYHGSLTKDWTAGNSILFAGYQKGLMDFYNGLHDFVIHKEKLKEKKKEEELEKKAQVYNPFLDEE